MLLARIGCFKRPGLLTGVFALIYGLSRFMVENFRVPDPQFYSSANPSGFAYKVGDYGVTMGQTLSLPMVAVGFFLIIFAATQKTKKQPI